MTPQQPDRGQESGFTMIEMAIVMTILLPILAGIAVTTSTVNSTVEANSRRADVMTYSRRMSQRIAKLVRPAQMSTITVQAVAQDVAMARAATIGEWIAPTDLVWLARQSRWRSRASPSETSSAAARRLRESQ